MALLLREGYRGVSERPRAEFVVDGKIRIVGGVIAFRQLTGLYDNQFRKEVLGVL